MSSFQTYSGLHICLLEGSGIDLTPRELPTRPFTYACVVLSVNSQAVLFRHLPRSGSAGGPLQFKELRLWPSVRQGRPTVGRLFCPLIVSPRGSLSSV